MDKAPATATAMTEACRPLLRLLPRSILARQHHRQDGLALVAGTAQGLVVHQRRSTVAVIVPDVEGNAGSSFPSLALGISYRPLHIFAKRTKAAALSETI
jgi:hypothetical protein